MKLTITGRKVTLKDSFKQKVEKKLMKFDRYFDEDSEARIIVTVEKERQTVEITINNRGIIYRAEETTTDMLYSLDGAVDSLFRQIHKNKTRLAKRMKAGAFEKAPEAEPEAEYDVVRVKKFGVKPMDVEEAILQMNVSGHQFFAFFNNESNEINIVYKRSDGGYGVLEPALV